MTTLFLNPAKYSGNQVTTVTNVERSENQKELTLAGKFTLVAGLGDTLVVYLNYKSPQTKYTILTFAANQNNVYVSHKFTLPQADTYIFETQNFEGTIDADLGPSPTVTYSSLTAAPPRPSLNMIGVLFNGNLTTTTNSPTMDLGSDYDKINCLVITGSVELTAVMSGDEGLFLQSSPDGSTWTSLTIQQYEEMNGEPIDELGALSSGNGIGDTTIIFIFAKVVARYFRLIFDQDVGSGEAEFRFMALKT